MNRLQKTFAIAAAALLSSPALAGTVDVDFLDTGLGREVRVHRSGHSSFNVFAGQLVHNLSNGTGNAGGLQGNFITFCIELTEHVVDGTRTFGTIGLDEAAEDYPSLEPRISAIRDIYAEADDRQFSSYGSGANKDFAAAFQIALWEVMTDFNGHRSSLNVAAGDLRVTKRYGGQLNSRTRGFLNDLFDAVGMNAAMPELIALTHPHFQDQLVMVPLPAPLGLAAAGLVMVAVRRRRAAKA